MSLFDPIADLPPIRVRKLEFGSIRLGGGMEVHKPKPVHSWREFLAEIGVIVIGVLIALSAEQVVETVHWRHRIQQTRDQLHDELRRNSRSAWVWLSSSPCQQAQIDGLEGALFRARTTHRVERGAAYVPGLWLWTDDAWLNARSLQIADHISPEEMRRYTVAYFFPTEMKGNIVGINKLAAELTPLRNGLDQVTAEEADGFLTTIGRIREIKRRQDLASIRLLQAAQALGVTLTKEDEEGARTNALADYGKCIRDPAPMVSNSERGSS